MKQYPAFYMFFTKFGFLSKPAVF